MPLLDGEQSLKAALDCDWDDPAERTAALGRVLAALGAVETWLKQQAPYRRKPAPQWRSPRPCETRMSRPCQRAWCSCDAACDLLADLTRQDVQLREIHLDRGYLASDLVRYRPEDLLIYCKAWPVRNGDRYAKTAFVLDWEAGRVPPGCRCPNQVVIPFHAGATVHFPEDQCQVCPLRERCTTSASGRSVHIHPNERLLQELRKRQLTAHGRAKLRERVPVEHALAHIGHWQGRRVRYGGTRKNLFDLRRCAVVHNLHAMQRLPAAQAA